MSMRNSHQSYALVKLTCPEGHLLGRVLMQPPSKKLLPMSGPGWLTQSPLSEPLAMRCPNCEAKGKHLDLRGSWEKITLLLSETLENPQIGTVSYRLGA